MGVGGQILSLAELNGIDKETDDHLVRFPPGHLHQREMTIMKPSHGGHKPDNFPFSPP